ncbi:hypothetical protein D3C71_1816410 [compost metagenome]
MAPPLAHRTWRDHPRWPQQPALQALAAGHQAALVIEAALAVGMGELAQHVEVGEAVAAGGAGRATRVDPQQGVIAAAQPQGGRLAAGQAQAPRQTLFLAGRLAELQRRVGRQEQGMPAAAGMDGVVE